MNAAPTLAFPTSRTLAGWWRQLAARAPRALWVGHLLLHQIEAPCSLVRACPIDPLTRHILAAISLEEGAADAREALRRLDAHLHLGTGVLSQALRALAREGLAAVNGSGAWHLTVQGRTARDAGEYPRTSCERRLFHFREVQSLSPRYLALAPHLAAPAPTPNVWGFDPAVLRSCVERPADWKRRHGFPEDVGAVPTPDAEPSPWGQIMLDRPTRLLVVLVRAADEGGDRVLGFLARQDGWVLQSAEPIFALPGDGGEVFPELSGSSSADEAVEAAWTEWAASRGVPPEEAAASVVVAEAERLRVRAPATLVARLKSARSDALRGDAWVLAGGGEIRRALVLEIDELTG